MARICPGRDRVHNFVKFHTTEEIEHLISKMLEVLSVATRYEASEILAIPERHWKSGCGIPDDRYQKLEDSLQRHGLEPLTLDFTLRGPVQDDFKFSGVRLALFNRMRSDWERAKEKASEAEQLELMDLVMDDMEQYMTSADDALENMRKLMNDWTNMRRG